MILTQQEEQALRLLISLGVAQKTGRPLTRLDELTGAAGTTEPQTQETLLTLGRGPEALISRDYAGAYRFTRHAEDITLADLILALRTQGAATDNTRHTAAESSPELSTTLRCVSQFLIESLDRISLGDLINIARHAPGTRTPTPPTARPRRRQTEEYLNGAGI